LPLEAVIRHNLYAMAHDGTRQSLLDTQEVAGSTPARPTRKAPRFRSGGFLVSPGNVTVAAYAAPSSTSPSVGHASLMWAMVRTRRRSITCW
jgi:hypothetical protein